MTDIHEGNRLKQWLTNHGLTPEALADKIGVSKQAVYLQLKKEYVSHTFKVKLSKAKLDIFANTLAQTGTENEAATAYKRLADTLEKQIRLEEVVILSQKMLQDHDAAIAELKKNYSRRDLDTLFRNQDTFRRNQDSKISKLQKDVESLKSIYAKVKV